MSSVAMETLEKEKDHPVADAAYYSAAIGVLAAQKGLHQPYKPKGWEKIPGALKCGRGRPAVVGVELGQVVVQREGHRACQRLKENAPQ